MNPFRLFLILTLAFLSLGTVRKRQDAIVMTQTDPIRYEEKEKELAEGKKGPPAPSLELFPRLRFLSEGPLRYEKLAPLIQPRGKFDYWLADKAFEEGFFDKENEEVKLDFDSDDTLP